MDKQNPAPYAEARVIGGRLVRVCPACGEQIAEHTDHDGMVSNRFAEHYQAEHREHTPDRPHYYVLACQPPQDGRSGLGAEALHSISRQAVEHVIKKMPEPIWQLVECVEDLPEGAPTIQAAHVLLAGFSKDANQREIRWYRREEERLVFTRTQAQLDRHREVAGRFFAAYDTLLADSERVKDESGEWLGMGYLKVADAVMASWNLSTRSSRQASSTGPRLSRRQSTRSPSAARRWTPGRRTSMARSTRIKRYRGIYRGGAPLRVDDARRAGFAPGQHLRRIAWPDGPGSIRSALEMGDRW